VTDWSVLNPDGSHSDPVPGNPDEVNSLATWFRQMSDDVSSSVSAIQRFDVSAGWRDQAAKKFDEHMGTLKKDLPKLRDSYGKAASALTTYQGHLRTSQKQAQQALNIALEAKANVDSAQRAKAAVTATPPASGQPPPDTSSYDRQEQDGHDRLAHARSLLHQACDDRDHAAATCRRQIQDAHHVGMHNKSWWDHVTGAVSDGLHYIDAHLEDIAKFASNLSAWLGTAALILSFIPVVNVIAPALEAASLVLLGVSMLAKTALLAEGRMSVGQYCMDAGIAALQVVGFKGGRMAGAAAKDEGKLADATLRNLGGKVAQREANLQSAIAAGKSERSLAASRGWVTRAENALKEGHEKLDVVVKRGFLDEEKKVAPVIEKWKHPIESTTVKYGSPSQWSSLPTSVRLHRVALPFHAVGHVADTRELVHEPLPPKWGAEAAHG
jgi:type VII secretion system ESX-1 substrate